MAIIKGGERVLLVCMSVASFLGAILLHVATRTHYTFNGQMIEVSNLILRSKKQFDVKECLYYQQQISKYGSRIYLHFQDGNGLYIPSDIVFFKAIIERRAIPKNDKMLPYAKIAFAVIIIFFISIFITLWYLNTYDMPPRA